MYTFIISMITAMVISLCFFGKKFWENRYLVLLIGIGVAIIATLTVNYFSRPNLETKIVNIYNKPINKFWVADTLIKFNENKPTFIGIDDFDFNKINVEEYLSSDNLYSIDSIFNKKDSTILDAIIKKIIVKKIPTYILIDDYYFYYIRNNKKRYKLPLNDFQFINSKNDTIAYIEKNKVIYDIPKKKSKWITHYSMPRVKTVYNIAIPPKQYNSIPDSIINKSKH